MTERRVDALHGTPVIVAAHRQQRPNLPVAGCPFCVGGLEAPEPYVVRAFENRWPSIDGGRAEVVLFSPDHAQSLGGLGTTGVRRVVDLWAERTAALAARDDVDYVLIFENRGVEVGATIHHPHGQIYGFGVVPPVPARELAIAEERGSCAVCDERAGAREIVRVGDGDEGWSSWIPYASGHPFGCTIAPDAHLGALTDLDDAARTRFATVLSDTLARLDAHFEEATPYMLWIHQRPTDGGAWPLAHLHVEIVPFRRAKGVNRYIAAAELGSGTLINSVDPLDAAAALRAATPTTPGGTEPADERMTS